jgi:hypothetical protein
VSDSQIDQNELAALIAPAGLTAITSPFLPLFLRGVGDNDPALVSSSASDSSTSARRHNRAAGETS